MKLSIRKRKAIAALIVIILGDEKKAKRGNTRAWKKRRQDRAHVQNIAYCACVDSQKSSRMSRAWPNALDNLGQHLKQKKCRALPLDNFELVQICLDNARQGGQALSTFDSTKCRALSSKLSRAFGQGFRGGLFNFISNRTTFVKLAIWIVH